MWIEVEGEGAEQQTKDGRGKAKSERDVNIPSSHDISGNKTFELSLSKAFQSNFTLVLGNVSMDDLGSSRELVVESEFVGLGFRLNKNDGTASHTSAVN